jgi:hypothetical protein
LKTLNAPKTGGVQIDPGDTRDGGPGVRLKQASAAQERKSTK